MSLGKRTHTSHVVGKHATSRAVKAFGETATQSPI